MSFKRKGASPSQPLPIGCRLSTHNSETLLSSGCSALDDIISSGGVPLRSTTLIKSDRYTGYSTLLLKYFVSQGLSSKQPVILVSLDEAPEELMKSLPVQVESSSSPDDGGEVDVAGGFSRPTGRVLGAVRADADTDKMRIAWRYNSMPKVSLIDSLLTVVSTVPYCCTFDITKQRDIGDALTSGAIQCLSERNLTLLYESIRDLLSAGGFLDSQQQTSQRHVARVVIHQFASLNWSPANTQPLFIFLTNLRRLIQTSHAVLFITLPAYTFNDFHSLSSHPLITLITHLSDSVLELESFSGTPRVLHPSYTNPPPSSPVYHGLIHVIKLPCLKSLVGASWRVLDPSQMRSLAFRVRRKRFAIEVFHLPPDEDIEDGDLEKGMSNMEIDIKEGGCGTGASKSSKLDF